MVKADFWKGKRVFLTGHTGFKGSWMCLWLHRMGATVTGYALPPPTEPSLFEMARIGELVDSRIGNVCDLASLEAAMQAAQPEIVIHMAAQSLVRYSYDHPVETFTTNVVGTVHLLDAVRRTPSVRSVVVVTSDKCYYNEEWVWGYREDSRLGGIDPYSGSKGAAELVVTAYQHSYFSADRHAGGPAVASARAGNVIGGGDWALDRLVPDIMRSLLKGEPTLIRNPQATRPWQHVLEPLNGYLMLAERLYTDRHQFASGWNFGPSEQSERTVGWIIEKLYDLWGVDFEWKRDANPGPPESTFLKLDASKARAHLQWRPKLDLETTLAWIVDWTREYQKGADMREVTLADIDRFGAIVPAA
ncbi:CDP-glucose 4,6-dehydratase [uncultured Piscinibacter sp.]|uniref:CDP-glucose 4,6-dehydratase n=1 Tax=uncultured Piscinibacter sp. TaxID=1131835 RepID=UPI002602AED7|nr:CDP-glucose 4,6-dehydratase [uncultured Piscinibacter sp.]